MNGHRARLIRELAWRAHTDAAVQTGDRRILHPGQITATARRIRRYYTRNGRTYPVSVDRPERSTR